MNKYRFIIMATALVMTVASTGIVIGTYEGPPPQPQTKLTEQAKIVWELYNQAEILLQDQQYQEAERLLARLLKIDPDNNQAQRLLAVCYYHNRRYQQAADMFRLFLIRNPEDVTARNNLGMALLQLHNIEAGIIELLRALHHGGEVAYLEYNLSYAFRELDDLNRAQDFYRRAILHDDDDAPYRQLDLISTPRENWIPPNQDRNAHEQD